MVEVCLQRMYRRPTEQPDPLLAPLADHPDLAASQVQAPEIRGGQLADAQPRGVRGLHERAIAQGERGREGNAVGAGRLGGIELAIHHGQQPRHLVDLEDARQSPRESWRRDRSPRVAGREPLAGGPAMERADRGKALGDRGSAGVGTEAREIPAQLRSTWPRPIDAVRGQPIEVGADRRAIGTDRVRRRVTRRQRAEEPFQARMGRRIARDRAHASGADSVVRLVRPPARAVRPPARPRPGARPPAARARAGRASAAGSGGPPG